jgi:hypothetical protein
MPIRAACGISVAQAHPSNQAPAGATYLFSPKPRSCRTVRALIPNPNGDLCKTGVAAFGRKPHSSVFRRLRRSPESPLRSTELFAEVSNGIKASIPAKCRHMGVAESSVTFCHCSMPSLQYCCSGRMLPSRRPVCTWVSVNGPVCPVPSYRKIVGVSLVAATG